MTSKDVRILPNHIITVAHNNGYWVKVKDLRSNFYGYFGINGMPYPNRNKAIDDISKVEWMIIREELSGKGFRIGF